MCASGGRCSAANFASSLLGTFDVQPLTAPSEICALHVAKVARRHEDVAFKATELAVQQSGLLEPQHVLQTKSASAVAVRSISSRPPSAAPAGQ